MKALKKAVALMLCIVMTVGIFAFSGITFDDLAILFTKAEAYTNTTIGRITQQQVVGTSTSVDGIAARDFWYQVYANGYFDGHSQPTDIVIPGLGDTDDYTPQGMTYWPEKNWILMSAYDAGGSEPTAIYAIRVSDGKFVALFNIYNADGTANTSHGGGIAASDHNFYFADSGSNVSYIPLSELDVTEGTEKDITIKGTLDFESEMNGANTSYCCYDDGVLWVGNFYYSGDSSYSAVANASHNSMLLGYKLRGESSQEEWNYLCGKYKNLVSITNASHSAEGYQTKLQDETITGTANVSYNAFKNGDSVDITGTVDLTDGYITEYTGSDPRFASVELTEGKQYVIEFKTNYRDSDLYIFAPNGGGHTNVKQSSQTKITQLEDGRWHYKMTFTAGLKPTGADSSWPTTQSTNGTYTGIYEMRFDQDNVNADRNFVMNDIAVRELNTLNNDEYEFDRTHFTGTQGYPTYVVAFPNTYTAKIMSAGQQKIYPEYTDSSNTYNFDRIQYAMVDNGRIYASRSWNRIMDASTHISEIDIIDIDLNVPGTYSLTIGETTRNDCYLVADSSIYQFHNLSMGEALCVIDDYLYTFTESAAYNYRKKDWDTNKDATDGPTKVASQPVDVVWKIDQYAIMGEERKESVGGNNVRSSYVENYERINSLDELNYNDTYMIVYESDNKAANGNKILYALDSYGGYKDGLVPKNSSGTQINTGDSIGIVGHPISKYATEGNSIKLNDAPTDDKDSLHWSLIGAGTGAFRIQNHDSYYGLYRNLYFGSRLMYMRESEGNTTALDHITIKDNGDGTFSFYYKGNADYYLWCNDGTNSEYMDAYNRLYNNTYSFGGDSPDTTDKVETDTGVKAYAGQREKTGTFHSDAFMKHNAVDSGNKTGEAVNEKYTKFHIYRRAEDLSFSGENGLSTDLNAELQADGTYTLTLESYSTGQTITQKSTNGKPIDFVFVLDTSASMTGNSDVPYWGISDWPEPYDYIWAEDSNGNRKVKYDGDSYYGIWNKRSNQQKTQTGSFLGIPTYDYWYKHTANIYSEQNPQDYYFGINSELHPQGSSSQNDMCLAHGFKKNDDKSFAGGFYWVDRNGDATRFEAMKQSTLDFIQQIQDHAEKTGLQHRIAIVQYGSTSSIDTVQTNSSGDLTYPDEGYYNTGMYSTVSGINMVNYGDLAADFTLTFDYSYLTESGGASNSTSVNGYGFSENNATYENAFFPANHDNLDQIVKNLSITQDSDTFVDHGMTMALNALADQMTVNVEDGDTQHEKIYGTYENSPDAGKYTESDINSKAVVINITDGAPGYSGSDGDAAYRSARAALDVANTIKQYDVDIYSVQIGTGTTASFDNAAFLDALSSNYIGGSATSKYETTANYLTKGTANGSGYYIQHNLSTQLELDGLFDQISQAGENSLLEVETVTLGSDSITLQSLGDTFMLTNDSKATAKTAQISYDALGRIQEGTPTVAGYTPTTDVANNTVKLTGFDYSTNYVATGNEGKKLILQIDGVLLNPDKANQFNLNLPISNDAKTAIYANSSALSSGTATQYFPQAYFEVPTYNYIYDYGLSMVNSSIYGTPISFDTVPDKQSTYATSVNIDGDAAIGYNGTNVTSNIAPDCDGLRESYVLLQKPNGSYYWAKIHMMPASNVYFEESFASPVISDYKDWSTAGSSAGLSQSLSGASDVYGYDAAYASGTSYSNGISKFVTVDSENNRSDTLTFDFTGTGIDLVSACGTKTGIQTVVIKDSSGALKKVYIVDTFYNDTSYGTLNQVPVVHFEDTYGTYTVETTATYYSFAGALQTSAVETTPVEGTDIEISSAAADSSVTDEFFAQIGMDELIGQEVELIWMDDNSVLNGGTGVEGANLFTQADGTTVSLENYFDGFRVYNPMQNTSAYPASEQGAKYYNIINNLAKSDNGIFTDITDIFAYIEGATFGELSFADYQKKGPQNELYLSNNAKGVTFKVNLSEGDKVMISARAVSGAPKLTVNGNAIAINSATEMYYDITSYLTATDGVASVAITNSGSGLLSLNNMKLVGATTNSLSTASLDDAVALMSLKPVDVEYSLPDDSPVAYPGSEPDREIENPDPDLDPVGEYPTHNANDEAINALRGFFVKIIHILERIFEVLKNVLPLSKEV